MHGVWSWLATVASVAALGVCGCSGRFCGLALGYVVRPGGFTLFDTCGPLGRLRDGA